MKVVNFVGGPGSGKSTTAAGVFFGMKVTAQHPVELVTERAKELTYDQAWPLLANQQAVTSEQDQRQRRLQGHVDYCITDSPLFLGCVYGSGVWAEDHMKQQWWNLFNSYDNITVYIERVKPYQPYGRSQSEDEARIMDRRLKKLTEGIVDFYVPGDEYAPAVIMGLLGLELPEVFKQQLAQRDQIGRAHRFEAERQRMASII